MDEFMPRGCRILCCDSWLPPSFRMFLLPRIACHSPSNIESLAYTIHHALSESHGLDTHAVRQELCDAEAEVFQRWEARLPRKMRP